MANVEIYPLPDDAQVDKWDREWMLYLSTEARLPHLVRSESLKIIADISQFGRRQVFDTALTMVPGGNLNGALRIWVEGDRIVGKRVAEIGCGAGFLGKQLGLISSNYLGIDVSMLAVAIARGNSPRGCQYFHLGEREEILAQQSSYDTVVGREFFIHQNFDNAQWVVRLAAHLLKPGGILAADFYLPNRAIPQGVLHPARSPLDPQHASCAFIFSDEDVLETAEANGLKVLSIEDSLADQRKFVTMVR